jgi:hypothetical protein
VVVRTLIGVPQHGPPRRRNGIVAYAAPIPKAPLEGRLNLTIPGVASIVDELVPDNPILPRLSNGCRGKWRWCGRSKLKKQRAPGH